MTTYNKNITVDTLKFLKEKFEQVDGKDFKLHCVKMVLPANTTEASRKKIWSVLWGDDQSHRWPEYTQYPLFERAEDTEPSHIVYGALVGTNVAEGCFAIESLMKETVKRLLLRNYEPESMPDSNTFLDNFWRFADTLEEYEIPIQHQAGEVYLWFEFLFKLSKEQRSFITADYLLSCLYMKELPCVPKIQGLKTDALKASILALDYLLSKAEQRYKQPKEQKVQKLKIKPVKKSEAKSLTTECQSARTNALLSAAAQLKQIADNFENWAKKQRAKFIATDAATLPPAFTLAKVEDWVNTWLSKQRDVAVFFSHPHLRYDIDDFALFITTERKEFHLIIDFFRLHMPAIATSLKELYDEFWEDVTYRIECYKRSEKVRQGDISPSTLIGESADDVSPELQPTLFLDGAVATLVRRLRHIAEMVREELATEKPAETGQEKKAVKESQEKSRSKQKDVKTRKSRKESDRFKLIGVLQELHGIGTKQLRLEPITSKELERKLGWNQPKVSREMATLFGDNPMQKYKQCFKGEHLTGFMKKLEDGSYEVDGIVEPDQE